MKKFKHLKLKGYNSSYVADFDIARERIIKKIKDGYSVLIIGAGNVCELAYSLECVGRAE